MGSLSEAVILRQNLSEMGVEETVLEYGFVCFARTGSVQLTLFLTHVLI